MDSALPPTDSRSVSDREVVEAVDRVKALVDAFSTGAGVIGDIADLRTLLDLYAKTVEERDEALKERNEAIDLASDATMSWLDPKAWTNRALAAEARAHKAEQERDEAREAMKWVGQVYPSAREGGAWVSMAWTEFNRMRRFVGLTELPRRAAKGERQSVNIRLREALAAAEARSEKAERERDEARGGWPEGWVLVPREPTEEMLDAGDAPFHNEWKRQREYAAKYGKPEGFGSAPFSEAIYRAMIAEAALSPPLVGGGSSAVSQSGSALRGAPSDAEGH